MIALVPLGKDERLYVTELIDTAEPTLRRLLETIVADVAANTEFGKTKKTIKIAENRILKIKFFIFMGLSNEQ